MEQFRRRKREGEEGGERKERGGGASQKRSVPRCPVITNSSLRQHYKQDVGLF